MNWPLFCCSWSVRRRFLTWIHRCVSLQNSQVLMSRSLPKGSQSATLLCFYLQPFNGSALSSIRGSVRIVNTFLTHKLKWKKRAMPGTTESDSPSMETVSTRLTFTGTWEWKILTFPLGLQASSSSQRAISPSVVKFIISFDKLYIIINNTIMGGNQVKQQGESNDRRKSDLETKIGDKIYSLKNPPQQLL